jgi:hypothetical protein
MSVVLYAMCLQPLLRTLEEQLPKIRIGHQNCHSTVFAYADDVTIVITRPEDFEVIRTAAQIFERASGARLNPRKSNALDVGAWRTAQTTLGIDVCDRVGTSVWFLDLPLPNQRKTAGIDSYGRFVRRPEQRTGDS